MAWMNEYEIEEAVERFTHVPDCPNLLAGAETLHRLVRWTNRNSDGWPYWQKPGNAAKALMDLLTTADRFDPQDCTEADLKRTYTPIKSFLTRHAATRNGVDGHLDVFPPACPKCGELGYDDPADCSVCSPPAHTLVTVRVHYSAGSDRAVVVQIDTDFEPDASDGGPGLRILLNDSDAYIGVAYKEN